MWLQKKQVLIVAVRGGARLHRECFNDYDNESERLANAVDFQGCILIFCEDHAKFTFRGRVHEHALITKVVDTSKWFVGV